MTTTALTQKLFHQKSLTLYAVSIVFALLSAYMYFVSVAVVEVVVRTEIAQDINHLASDISELESEYIRAQHKVSGEIAVLEGYQKNSKKVFIDRSGENLVLAPNSLR